MVEDCGDEPTAHARSVLGRWALALLGALVEAGIRELIISPGSRSTPFVWAALQHRQLRCTSISDERAAAFFALGQAKISGVASALLCTSGSAAAHCLPAVIEAAYSYTPLLLLTADRPPSMHHCGAAQTIDQHKLFGDHARFFADLGLPDGAPDALRAMRRLAAEAVHRSLHPTPGAVHLNAPADKPLEPLDTSIAIGFSPWRAVPTFHAPRCMPSSATVATLAERCVSAGSGLLVGGPAPLQACSYVPDLQRLSRSLGFPLLAEATSQARFVAGDVGDVPQCALFDAWLATSEAERSTPELVLQIGASPIAGHWERWLSHHRQTHRVLIHPYGYPDPDSSASELVQADVGISLRLLADAVDTALQGRVRAPSSLAESLHRWQALYLQRLDELLQAQGNRLSEAAATRALLASMPEGGLLVIGNSLPIRHLEAWCPPLGKRLAVVSQRGASGIDGMISGACGAAHAYGQPAAALLGDVTFLHDLPGMMAGRELEQPLVMVVLQNRGGRIFDQLPVASTPYYATDAGFWTTPHGADVGAAAKIFGWPYAQASTVTALRSALADAWQRRGPSLIEAVVDADTTHGMVRAMALAARQAASL